MIGLWEFVKMSKLDKSMEIRRWLRDDDDYDLDPGDLLFAEYTTVAEYTIDSTFEIM